MKWQERSGIYIASRARHAHLWRHFQDTGWPLLSTWIHEDPTGAKVDYTAMWAQVDAEIAASAALILYAEGVLDFPFKGALVEVGMALAHKKRVYVVLDGVMIDESTLRPIGSWICAQGVHQCEDLEQALCAATHELAAKRGWVVPPAQGNVFGRDTWNTYWLACWRHDTQPELGRPVAPHRSAAA